MAILECVGCGRDIGWDGRGTLCYTCPCGATVFWSPDGTVAYPGSLVLGVARGHGLHHLDYYVGVSAHSSPEKTALIRRLRSLGSVWPWECEECRSSPCPFRWQCSRFSRPSGDDEAVVAEICVTGRHLDCIRYTELRDSVVASEESGP